MFFIFNCIEICPLSIVSFPWDQSTPLGYFGEVCFSILPGEAYIYINGMLALLFVSLCLLYRAFYERFQYTLNQLKRPDKRRNDRKLLCNLIQFHKSIKE